MRYLMLYRPDRSVEAAAPPSQEHMAEMGKFIEELMNAGTLLQTGGLLPSAQGACVRLSGGKLAVTDGPFTEAKEVIGGFAIVQAKSKAEAIDLAKRFLNVAGDGETEVRPLHEPSDVGP